MKNNIKKLIKKIRLDLYVWVKYNLVKDVQIEKNQSICSIICRKLIKHPDSKFLIAPISNKKYIKNETLGLFVVLDNCNISITNHLYHYDIKVPIRQWNRLTYQFNSKTESIRQEYESEIKSQIVYSLHNILDKIN